MWIGCLFNQLITQTQVMSLASKQSLHGSIFWLLFQPCLELSGNLKINSCFPLTSNYLFLYFSHFHKKKYKCLFTLAFAMQNHKIFDIFCSCNSHKLLGMWAPNTFLAVKSGIKVTDPLTNEILSVLQTHVEKPKYSWNIETFEKIHFATIEKLSFPPVWVCSYDLSTDR